MQAELMTGPVRRRRWSDEEKIRILKEAFAPGAVVSDVAHRNDIRPPQIYRNRHEDLTEGGSTAGSEADRDPILAQSLDGLGDFQIPHKILGAG